MEETIWFPPFFLFCNHNADASAVAFCLVVPTGEAQSLLLDPLSGGEVVGAVAVFVDHHVVCHGVGAVAGDELISADAGGSHLGEVVDLVGVGKVALDHQDVYKRQEYTARTNANKKYNSIDTGKTDIAGNNQYYVQLGEELYNGDLKLADDEADVFGRPAHTWSFDGEKIGTYVNYDLMVEEYTTSVSGKELYDVVGKTAFDKYDFSAYVDGKDDDFYKQISKNKMCIRDRAIRSSRRALPLRCSSMMTPTTW